MSQLFIEKGSKSEVETNTSVLGSGLSFADGSCKKGSCLKPKNSKSPDPKAPNPEP